VSILQVIQPEAVAAYRDDVLPVRVNLGQSVARRRTSASDGLLADASPWHPADRLDHVVARADAPGGVVEHFQQAVLRWAERRVDLIVVDETRRRRGRGAGVRR